MTTLDVVSSKKKSVPSAEETAAKELVRAARAQGLSLTGPGGLLKQFTKSVLETALNEELTEHLGHGSIASQKIGSQRTCATGPGRRRSGTAERTISLWSGDVVWRSDVR